MRYLLIAITTIIICNLLIFALTEKSDIKAEAPTIDGVMIRNEAQMFNGYNQ